MAGSIAGARHRAAVIPTRWLDALEEGPRAAPTWRAAPIGLPVAEAGWTWAGRGP